jgi:hypothetical protein
MQGVKLDISEAVIRQLASEQSDTWASRKLGIAVSSFFLLRKKYGIPSFTSKTKGARRSLVDGRLLRKGEGIAHPCTAGLRSDFFDCIDTPEKAYFLGLMATDGHTEWKPQGKFLSLELQERDGAIVKRFAELLNAEHKIERIAREGKKPTTRVRIYSSRLTAALMGHGVTLDTETQFLPASLRSDLRRHCIRGVLDGDGHIDAKKGSCYICGCSSALMSTVADWLREELGIEAKLKSLRLKSGKTFYQLLFSGRPAVVLAWAYENQTLSIERKSAEAEKWLLKGK